MSKLEYALGIVRQLTSSSDNGIKATDWVFDSGLPFLVQLLTWLHMSDYCM